MIAFANPQLLWLLLVLPLVALLRSRRGPRAAVRLREHGPGARGRTHDAQPVRPVAAVRAAAGARADDRRARAARSSARETTSVKASGVDVMLALDVSGSMASLDLTLDGKPADRLSVVKSVVAKFIDRRPNDRIGMIAFAGVPYLVSPLTLDHDWLERNLDARPARHDRGRHRDRLGAERRRSTGCARATRTARSSCCSPTARTTPARSARSSPPRPRPRSASRSTRSASGPRARRRCRSPTSKVTVTS